MLVACLSGWPPSGRCLLEYILCNLISGLVIGSTNPTPKIMTDANSDTALSLPVSAHGDEHGCADTGAGSAGTAALLCQGVVAVVPGVDMPAAAPLLRRSSRPSVCESFVLLSPPATDVSMSGERAQQQQQQQQLPSWHLPEPSPLTVAHQSRSSSPMQQHRYVPTHGSLHPYHHHIQHHQHVQYTPIPPPPLPHTYQPAPPYPYPYPPTHSLPIEQHTDTSNAKQRMKQQTFLTPPTLGGVRANKAQVKVLQHIFLTEKKPTGAMQDAIAERIGMSQGAVRNW
ncbi:hypothetical protein CcCBS67573_g08226 [Chytriomyces confervae]|uniref:Homeobox domain-containing protein n=1 Tax=Chytriomyces confervae TaxID=246404 RepID=A0A507EMS7_9FUNG|nr:hypothetical protein CcCBS67573_g08226 [Chytriomyces confervae]